MATDRIPTDPITENITLSKTKLAVSIVAACFGVALALRGAYGIGTQGLGGSADRVVASLQQGRPANFALRDAARVQLLGRGDGAAISMAGYVALAEARYAGFSGPQGKAWLAQAIDDLRLGLSKSPADGFAWLRLASAEMLLNGSTPKAAAAIQMAFYAVRRSQKADPLFLSISAEIWPRLSPEVQDYVLGYIRTKWASQNLHLHGLAQTEAGRRLLSLAVGADPKLPAWIENRILRDKVRRDRLKQSQGAGPDQLRGGR